MVTRIADIIEPTVFADYVTQRTSELSRLVQSGLVDRNGEFDGIAASKGRTFPMPFWQDLTGASEELSDTGALTVGKITSAQDVAVKHFRGKAWGANDLAKYIAGADPMQAIGDLVANFWMRDYQKTILVPTLNGLFASGGALASTHVSDITEATNTQTSVTDANRIGAEAVIDAANKLGDAWEQIVAMCMHSAPFARLQKLNLIEFVPLQGQSISVPTFLGREVIVDDGMPTTAITGGYEYATFLFGRGAIALGEGGPAPEEAAETDRDSLAGEDVLITRRHFIMHPRGVAWVGSAAGDTPTAAELATAGNWARRYEAKQVPIVKLLTNN